MMFPGCAGRRIIFLISLLLMVITIIDEVDIAINKLKKDPPITGHPYRVKAFFNAG